MLDNLTEEIIDNTVAELNEIVWRLSALKDTASYLRRSAATEEDIPYDHLLLMGEMGVEKVSDMVTGLLDSYEEYSVQRNAILTE